MALNTKFISDILKDTKKRNLLLFLSVFVIAGIIYLAYSLHSSVTSPLGAAGDVKLESTPTIANQPGFSQTTQQYAQTQQQANVEGAKQAAKTGKSFIPILTGSAKPIGAASQGNQSQKSTQTKSTSQLTISPQKKAKPSDAAAIAAAKAKAQQEKLAAELARERAQQTQQVQAEASKEAQQQQQQMSTNMKRVAKQLFTAWVPTAQTYVEGEEPKVQPSGTGQTNQSGQPGQVGQAGSAALSSPIIKAGTILFAVLNTAVDTDEPGPVMATIVSGKYKGGKLLGTVTRQNKAAQLAFATLNLPKYTNSFGVDAVAIDPKTARTALASKVDNHYLLRYGTLFASAFLEGYGQAVSQGSTISVFDGASITTQPQLDPSEQLVAAIGNVGTRWGQQLGNVFNTPPTVTVKSGLGVGILFMKDVSLRSAITNTATPANTQGLTTAQISQLKNLLAKQTAVTKAVTTAAKTLPTAVAGK